MALYDRYKELESRYDIAGPAERDDDLTGYWAELRDAAEQERERYKRLAAAYREGDALSLRLLRVLPHDPQYDERAERFGEVVDHIEDRKLD